MKDTSGAILPGVTVEAASPALIEKVRTVVTDSKGEYKIIDLRPGTYTVTFTLPGFNTAKREGVDLPSTFASNYGKASEVFNGVDTSVSVRLPHGAFAQGGVSTGRTEISNCFTVNSPQALRFCDVVLPFSAQTQLKISGAYPLPWDFAVGGRTIKGMFDAYNLFNANSILAINSAYSPAWKTPTQILDARLFKFGAQLEF